MLKLEKLKKQQLNNYGYHLCIIYSKTVDKPIGYSCHRFILECIRGLIPEGFDTHHKNSIRTDNCVRCTRTQPVICVGCSVHYWLPCAINNGGSFEIAFVVVVDTHLPRFEALAYVLPHFDELTHLVMRASSSVCRGLLFCLRKAFIF